MEMKERPANLTAAEVRGILDGTCTSFRRPIRLLEGYDVAQNTIVSPRQGVWWEVRCEPWATVAIRCPFGVPGDRLWVREAWKTVGWAPERSWQLSYEASLQARPTALIEAPESWERPLADIQGKWVPSIHMPRWASRLSLEVVEVRAQRVQEITEQDARAAGAPAIPRLDGSDPRFYRQSFAALWDSAAPAGQQWADNPWVWAATVKRVQG